MIWYKATRLAVLDGCLLDEEEWSAFERVMCESGVPGSRDAESKAGREYQLSRLFEDGFPDWAEDEEGVDGMNLDHSHSRETSNGVRHNH